MRLRLKDLPENIRRQVREQAGPAESVESPYAARLGRMLDEAFPGLVVAEHHPIPGRRYRVDFALPDDGIAIEFDGYRSHGLSKEGFVEGLRRQNLLVLHGWLVLRYSLTDVRDDPCAIVEQVCRLLKKSAAPRVEGKLPQEGVLQ
ncbi:DUF559 domain-containing protein [Acidithiobacillus sp. VAN18-1]|uniref:DUF559 domain-containing protein n=1 Tax=Igneacidithiobacillus copahuensis TaxID=2724909 RepID=A0AAE2YR12_9PROT|nr:DUF559 domain-containing protein [Igneacidithiobacillus copahuensis]MBU2788650.1 DUF559 domain-containing protein [Igneacidithiobacillus copahuensis]MBU2796666.1 DUF559 domain-containing protein [Acidithiobacillus sp. VAN18-2]